LGKLEISLLWLLYRNQNLMSFLEQLFYHILYQQHLRISNHCNQNWARRPLTVTLRPARFSQS